MVGVPGRSKGCKTCRRRKKGCDLTRPGCKRCKAAGLTCEGYTIERCFVNGGVKRDNQESPDSRQMTPSQEKRPWLGRYTTRADTSKNNDSNIVLSDSLVRTARQQLYMGHLWTTMLPKGGHFSSDTWRLSAPGWAGLVSMLYDTEPSLKYVTFAMAMGCLATQCNDNQMRFKSLQTYNTAVQELSTTLQQRDAHKRDGLIVAAGLMASFELIFVPIDEPRVMAWKHHTDGQQSFFLNRGPMAFTSGSAHQLFVDSRINMAMLAIGKRSRSPFSSHEWKTIPWASATKSPKDRLMDIMLEIPMLLETMKELQSSTCLAMAEVAQEQLLGQCMVLDRAMRVWAAKMGTDILRFDYTFIGESIPLPQKEGEFILLHLSIVYWFIEMMLFSITCFVSNKVTNKAAEAERRLKLAAQKSARALPLLFDPSGGLAQNITGLLALSIAMRYFQTVEQPGKRSAESVILESLLDQELNGSSIGTFLARIYFQNPKSEIYNPANIVCWF